MLSLSLLNYNVMLSTGRYMTNASFLGYLDLDDNRQSPMDITEMRWT